MKRIHIVGVGPRTGTTLMAEAMISCFDIDLYTSHEDRIFVRPHRKCDVFLTKAPIDILVVEPILKADPDLHVICMIRDPQDTIVSKHGKDPDRYWAGLRFWRAYTPFAEKLVNHPRFTTVRYEDLVSKPDEVQDSLEKHLPFLRKKAPFSRYHEVAHPSGKSVAALKGVRPISADGIGKWRNHLPRVVGQIKLHGPITDDLIKYGYEKDDSWMECLLGVAPNTSPGHFREHFPTLGIWRLRWRRNLEANRLRLRGFLKRAFS